MTNQNERYVKINAKTECSSCRHYKRCRENWGEQWKDRNAKSCSNFDHSFSRQDLLKEWGEKEQWADKISNIIRKYTDNSKIATCEIADKIIEELIGIKQG